MASKTVLLLLLIGTVVVQIYTQHNKCPNNNFKTKHTCKNCNINEIETKAAAQSGGRVNSVGTQTIYNVRANDLNENSWKNDGTYCEWETAKPKYRCNRKWHLDNKGKGIATHPHNGGSKCPVEDFKKQHLCSNCPDEEKKEQFADNNSELYHPWQAFFFVIQTSDLDPGNWERGELFCKLKGGRKGLEYEAKKIWKCKDDGTGKGKHWISDGHLYN